VLVVQTGLRPRELLEAAHRIEADFGRVRDERFGPRTLDIDIIAYADVVSDDPVLTLPHPRAHERAFVLVPWHDADARAELPGRGPVTDVLARLDASGVRRVPGAVLRRPRSGAPGELP
jgi:2-amino-4-hydroxy-6-hydroxymethyldihydropteridine diphosphokinase